MNLLPLACCLVAFLALWRGLCWWMFSYDQARKAGLIYASELETHTRSERKEFAMGRFPEAQYHMCGHCGGAINKEHHAVVRWPTPQYASEKVYCDFCGVGYEFMLERAGDDGPYRQTGDRIRYSADNPEALAHFVEELEQDNVIVA